MALHVVDGSGVGHAAGAVIQVAQAIGVAHGGLVELIVLIAPQHHAIVAQLNFFIVVGKMLQDDVGIGGVGADETRVVIPNGDP